MTAIDILKQCTVEVLTVRLPEGQLDRDTYNEVAQKLELIGGKWKGGKTKGFVFNEDPTAYLEKLCAGEAINLKKEFQFFATPDNVASRLVELACIEPDNRILEPSAGQGAIIKAIHREHPEVNVDYYELMDINRSFLEKLSNCTLIGNNFITEPSTTLYDRIIANPPFAKNQDIDHVSEMYRKLDDGGVLVSVMSNHWRKSSNKKETAFSAFIQEVGADVYEIEAGAFKESGTNISACIVVITRTTNGANPPKREPTKTDKTYKHRADATKDFESYFEALSGKYSPGVIFIDFLDYALLAMKWWETNRDFSYYEQKYGEAFPRFMDMFIAFSEASDNGGLGFRDALGDLFMELVSHGHNGQYFTPDPVCDMMTQITMPQIKDGQSVLDPACGSGRMLLAAAKCNRHARFYGCDIDIVCCKMAVINLLINSLDGEVALMDSLRMEYTKSWKVGTRNVQGVFLPVYREIEDKEESALWHNHINSFGQIKPADQAEVVNEVAQVAPPLVVTRQSEAKLASGQLSLW